jgi:hypothetical protein
VSQPAISRRSAVGVGLPVALSPLSAATRDYSGPCRSCSSFAAGSSKVKMLPPPGRAE